MDIPYRLFSSWVSYNLWEAQIKLLLQLIFTISLFKLMITLWFLVSFIFLYDLIEYQRFREGNVSLAVAISSNCFLFHINPLFILCLKSLIQPGMYCVFVFVWRRGLLGMRKRTFIVDLLRLLMCILWIFLVLSIMS